MNIRKNSRLRQFLGEDAVKFLIHGVGAIQRILPHVEIIDQAEVEWKKSKCAWADSKRRQIRLTIAIGKGSAPFRRSITATVQRRSLGLPGAFTGNTLDMRESAIC